MNPFLKEENANGKGQKALSDKNKTHIPRENILYKITEEQAVRERTKSPDSMAAPVFSLCTLECARV